jgi:exosome complex component RRP45
MYKHYLEGDIFFTFRVAAQVSCDIRQPKASRPNEGMLFINVELSTLAALHFDSNKQLEATSLLNMQLMKCLKDSNCVDLESLCIVADKMVNINKIISILFISMYIVQCVSLLYHTGLEYKGRCKYF